MTESILDSTKKILGIDPGYDVFDPDIMTHINTVFVTLNQLGIGPAEGYMITGADDTWDAFVGTDVNLNSVKTYVFLRVRIIFDPPATSYHLKALEEQYKELEWRLNTRREEEVYVPPASTGEDDSQ